MSKIAAIDVAVRLQLAADNRLLDYAATFASMQDVAGNAAPYTKASMRTFLLNVSNRLRLDEPAWLFPWSQLATEDSLDHTIASLVADVAEQAKRDERKPVSSD